MNSNRRSVLLVSALGIIALVTWWLGFRESPAELPMTTMDSSQGLPLKSKENTESVAEAEEVQVKAEVQPGSTVKRIVQVPFSKVSADNPKSIFDDASKVTAENLIVFSKHNLEAALAGDIDAAYRASRGIGICNSIPKTLEGVDRQADRTARAFEEMRSRGDYLPIRLKTKEENRIKLTSWFEACLGYGKIFNETLRERLDRLAQQGDVVARYLFSVWPPDFLGLTDAFLLQQDWESKARDYSFENLEQGELLGLLAFAESYSGGTFTRHDRNMTYAFYIAAFECGFADHKLQRSVDNFLSDEMYDGLREDVRPQVLTITEGLSSFCR